MDYRMELAYGFQEDVAILSRVLKTIERRAKFLLDTFIARGELIAENVQQRKIHLVDPVRASGMHRAV